MKTINEKKVDNKSLQFEDVFQWDYPDFSDAFISSAEFNDGTPLTDEELDQLNDDNGFVYENLWNSLH